MQMRVTNLSVGTPDKLVVSRDEYALRFGAKVQRQRTMLCGETSR